MNPVPPSLLFTIKELLTPGIVNAAHSEIWPSILAADEHALYWAIKRMPYNGGFLRTPYWYAVSSSVKQRAGGRCQLCYAGGQMHAHHRTYDNHGAEHNHMNDLVCLCRDCHDNRHHGKPKKVKAFKSSAVRVSGGQSHEANVIQGQAAYVLQLAKQSRVDGVPDRKKAHRMLIEKIVHNSLTFHELKRRAGAVKFWFQLIE